MALRLDPRGFDSKLVTVIYRLLCKLLPITRFNLATIGLLASLHLLKHLPPDVLCEFSFQQVFLYLANIGIVHTLPHDLQRLHLLTLLLPFSELLNLTSNLRSQLGELLRLLECRIGFSLSEVAELPLLDFDEFVDFLRCRPEVAQVGTLRLQSLVKTSCCE